LPKILREAPSERRGVIRDRFSRLSSSPEGLFALIDYVNFKGEGTKPTERYRGEGWGLLQVLDDMTDDPGTDAVDDFVQSASRVLERRVRNSPAERGEKRWLAGWLSRLNSYRDS
jgi:hypothetical protein